MVLEYRINKIKTKISTTEFKFNFKIKMGLCKLLVGFPFIFFLNLFIVW